MRMPLVSFRPHSISVLNVEKGSYDSKGDYIPSREAWSGRIPCRYEPNGSARTIPFGDGKNYVYDYTVYIDRSCPQIEYGQKVELFDESGNTIGRFSVRGFYRNQLNAKLWV